MDKASRDFLGFRSNALSFSNCRAMRPFTPTGVSGTAAVKPGPCIDDRSMRFLGMRISLRLGMGALVAFLSCAHAPMACAEADHPPPALADVPATPARDVWTLERALTRAMQANPDLLVAKHELERQEGAKWQIQAQLLPSLAATASASHRQPSMVDTPPDPTNRGPPSEERNNGVALARYDMRIEVRQLVFDGLSSWHQVKRQELLSNQAYLTLRATVLRVVSQVRQAFDAVLMRNAVVEAERRRVEEFAQVVSWTERKHAAGEIAEFELLRAEAELQGARAELAESIRQLGEAEQGFRRLLQLSDLSGRLVVEGEFRAREFALPIEDALAQARANRPDLAAADAAVKAAHRNQLAMIGGYLPKVEVFAGYGASSSYYNSENLLSGWTVGAAGQWSLFDGGTNRGRRIALRAERRIAETRLGELQHEIASKLRELYQSLEQTRVSLDSQTRSLDLAARASRDAQRLYELGQASLEQVLQAEMTHRRAMSRMSEVVYSHNAIVAEIEYSVGGQISDSLTVPEIWKQ